MTEEIKQGDLVIIDSYCKKTRDIYNWNKSMDNLLGSVQPVDSVTWEYVRIRGWTFSKSDITKASENEIEISIGDIKEMFDPIDFVME